MSWRRPAEGLLLAFFLLTGLCGSLRAQERDLRPVQIDSVVVVGNERVSRGEIIAQSRLQPGREVRGPDVQEAVQRLFDTGDFSDVEIRVTPGDPAVFYVIVTERPYIFEFEFTGLVHVEPGAVRDTARLPAEGPLNPARVKRARGIIEARLAQKGFPRATVDTVLSAAGPGLPGYRLTFRVDEGPRLSITGVEVDGNEAFSDSELEAAMSTGSEGFLWWNSGEFNQEEYEQDLARRLPDFYARHGYIDMAVVEDTVIVDRQTGKGKIRVRVEEGAQYRLADFQVEGSRRFPASELRTMYTEASEIPADGAAESPPFDLVGFRESAAEVEELYRNSGYLSARVLTQVVKVSSEGAEASPRVRATWTVQEGQPAYIRHVRISGNTFTHDRVIRERLSIVPGDVYSQQRLINSIQRVQGLGFFEQLPPQEAVEIDFREDGDVDITLRVKEKSTGNLNFGMSAAAATGIAGFIGYEQPNLFGQAKTVRFRWLFGSRTNDVSITYSDPDFFGNDKSATVSLLNSRDVFRTFSVGTRRQIGASVEVGWPVPGSRFARFFAGYSVFRDKLTDLTNSSLEDSRFVSSGTRSSVNLRVVRDSRNSNLFPTAGSRNVLRARFSGGPLGGSGEFAKYEFESSWHVPVATIGATGLQAANAIQLTASISFKGGLIVGDNPFFRERFFMGGTQFGEQLRGYEEATVTPTGHIPRNARTAGIGQLARSAGSFFTSTTQVGAKLTNNIFLSGFLDAGNVWEDAGEFNPNDLLTGAGVGATLMTPFGPLGVDYAYGFNRRDVLGRPDPGWKLHFKFGRIF